MIHSPEIHHYVVGLKMGENVRWKNSRADWLEYPQVLLSYEVWPAEASGFRGPGNRGPTECGTTHEATSGTSS